MRTLLASVCAACAAVCSLVSAPPADAAWSVGGSGASAGRAVVMPAGSQPTGIASGSDVTLRWPAALLPDGTPVAGYVINRIGVNGTPVAVLADCYGTVASTTCTERGVPAGTWTYTDTPVQASWTGQASTPSTPVTVPGT